jgi:beta-glucosidase
MKACLYLEELPELVRSGVVDEALIDDAVRRILRVKFELGLFDDPYRYCDEEREKAVIGSKEIREAALDMARKSMVLLKNEGDVLPLEKSGQTVALIGALADDPDSPLGSWRLAADDNSAVTVRQAMEAYQGNTLIQARYSGRITLTRPIAHFFHSGMA